MKKTTHRWFRTLVAYYTRGKEPAKDKPVAPFVDMNPAEVMKSIWMGRLRIKPPVSKAM